MAASNHEPRRGKPPAAKDSGRLQIGELKEGQVFWLVEDVDYQGTEYVAGVREFIDALGKNLRRNDDGTFTCRVVYTENPWSTNTQYLRVTEREAADLKALAAKLSFSSADPAATSQTVDAKASNEQAADHTDASSRSKNGGEMPSVRGQVLAVNRTWNFVVLNIGRSAGVVPHGELMVNRGQDFLGKVRVSAVEPNGAVADILPDVKGEIQVGDAVLTTNPDKPAGR